VSLRKLLNAVSAAICPKRPQVAGVAAALTALLSVTAVPLALASPNSATDACKSQSFRPGQANSAIERESGLLQAAVAQGWQLTPAGRAILNGALPRPNAHGDGSFDGSATVAIAPKGLSVDLAALRASGTQTSSLRFPQGRQGSKRALGTNYVFLNCGLGQQANVNYYVVAGATTWVQWLLINFQTSATRSPTSSPNYCPSGSGGCLEFYYIKPASPWYVFSAEEIANIGTPEGILAYCGG
jgi:hypothetical protein